MIKLEEITPRQKLVISKGLLDYRYIMSHLEDMDDDFQAVYYDFYLKARWARMSKQVNKDVYFGLLDSISPETSIIDVLNKLKGKDEKGYEFSIGSKLLHTVNDSLPIYDRKIREYLCGEKEVNFWWQIPNKISGAPRGMGDMDKIEHDWNELCGWYKTFLILPEGKKWLKWFDETFPGYEDISAVKKVDFIIFAAS